MTVVDGRLETCLCEESIRFSPVTDWALRPQVPQQARRPRAEGRQELSKLLQVRHLCRPGPGSGPGPRLLAGQATRSCALRVGLRLRHLELRAHMCVRFGFLM